MPRRAENATKNAMQRLEGEGVRGVVARVVRSSPVPRGDAMVARVVELIAAIAREGDVRRALGKPGKAASRIGDVAAVAAELDASIDARTDAGELAVRAVLEVLLDQIGGAPEFGALLPAFVARLVERWVLAQLGHAPTDHFASVAEHAQFRAEVSAVVRAAARSVRASEFDDALTQVEETLRGGEP